jgi:hypothetical protein
MKISVRAACVSLVFCLAVVATTDANHAWGKYHWARTSNPFFLKAGDNVGSAWDSYLTAAIADWNVSKVVQLDKVAGNTTGTACQPTSGRIEVCNASYGKTGWLGVAQIWVTRGGHITQALTKVNDTYFNTSGYNTPAWRQMVMCQELAHDFGLDHQDERFSNPNLGSCMDYTNNPLGPPSNDSPNAHDFAQIEKIYAHLDSTTTVGLIAPRGTSPNLNHPSAWGQLVRSHAAGRVQVFERNLGRGEKLITHVFWADPEHDHAGAH